MNDILSLAAAHPCIAAAIVAAAFVLLFAVADGCMPVKVREVSRRQLRREFTEWQEAAEKWLEDNA